MSTQESGELPGAQAEIHSIQLKEGLTVEEMNQEMLLALRLSDTGKRALAFYLDEMYSQRLYQGLGFTSISGYGFARLDLRRTECMELVRAGRELRDLKLIDAAFARGDLSWSRVVKLLRVADVDNEEEWLKLGLTLSWRELCAAVKGRKKGDSPRKPGQGLPEVKFHVRATLNVVEHQKLELAREKLSHMRGERLNLAQTLTELSEMLLKMRPDGSLPGWRQVEHSLYTVVVHAGQEGEPWIQTDEGKVSVDPEARAAMLGQTDIVNLEDLTRKVANEKGPTPDWLRRLVISRDGNRCRCCGSRNHLMVHHIIWLSRGGVTSPENLISLCSSCHALVHEELLQIHGLAPFVKFTDRHGAPLEGTPRSSGVSIELPPQEPETLETPEKPQSGTPDTSHRVSGVPDSRRAVSIQNLPDRVTADWWRKHRHLFAWNERHGVLVIEPGFPISSPPDKEHADRASQPLGAEGSRPVTLDDFIGQQRVRRVLRVAARAAKIRGEAAGHCLLAGQAGLGKTSLARAFARERGVRCHDLAAALIRDPFAMVSILASLDPSEVLFIDEVHALRRRAMESLYQAMEDSCVSLAVTGAGSGCETRTLTVELPAFSLLAATTDDDRLPRPFRQRFRVTERLEPYKSRDLVRMAKRAAKREGFTLAPEAASILAGASRGAPRQLFALLDHARDEMEAAARSSIDTGAARAALAARDLDARGLTSIDRRALEILRKAPRPLAATRLAGQVGLSLRAWSQDHEPFLVGQGLIAITPQGRTVNW